MSSIHQKSKPQDFKNCLLAEIHANTKYWKPGQNIKHCKRLKVTIFKKLISAAITILPLDMVHMM